MPSKTSQTTAEQGYGWAHQQARADLLRDLEDGEPCARCGEPMYRWQAAQLDADHVENSKAAGEPPDALSHASCNRSHGATQGNLARAGHMPQLAEPRTSRAW